MSKGGQCRGWVSFLKAPGVALSISHTATLFPHASDRRAVRGRVGAVGKEGAACQPSLQGQLRGFGRHRSGEEGDEDYTVNVTNLRNL